ncbi:MAG: thiamine pyrophosphate-dependent dehydrogenase E1 component subunit alpha [Bacteroidetes bacterium]|nr:thiamine pyrophosphate-dependent dehydrogenase E1 component subunit alpha [Bacteroidota bacterium]
MPQPPLLPVVQFLDEKGVPLKGKSLPTVPDQDLILLLKTMIRVRVIDARMFKMQRQGRIAFYMSTYGEEATHIGATYALKPQDWIFPQYREQGAAFLRGFPLQLFVNQIFGNAGDIQKGRQMPMHWGSRDHNLVTISSTLGTQIPQSVGTAYAMKLKKQDAVTLAFFGEGTTSEGDFHAACNFAGVYKTPSVLFCRNNGWAISTPFNRQTAAESIAVKSFAYGIEGVRVDGNDIFAVIEVTRQARERAVSGGGATLIEALTYRLSSHSTSDDPSAYRSEDRDDGPWKDREPLVRLRHYMMKAGLWTSDEEKAWEQECEKELIECIKQAESIGKPDADIMFDDIYDEIPWHLQEQKEMMQSFLKMEGKR